MPEHLISRDHLAEVLVGLYREKGERLVYAMPVDDYNLRVITVVVDKAETRTTYNPDADVWTSTAHAQ